MAAWPVAGQSIRVVSAQLGGTTLTPWGATSSGSARIVVHSLLVLSSEAVAPQRGANAGYAEQELQFGNKDSTLLLRQAFRALKVGLLLFTIARSIAHHTNCIANPHKFTKQCS